MAEKKNSGNQIKKAPVAKEGRSFGKRTVKASKREEGKSFAERTDKMPRKEAGKTFGKGTDKAAKKESGKTFEKRTDKASKREGGKSFEKRSANSVRKEDTKLTFPCPVFRKCGGCHYLNMTYAAQLKKKESQLKELCGGFGKLEPILGMEQPLNYRNKVHAVFGEGKKHEVISGIYEEKTHRIVPLDSCLLEDEKSDQIIVSIRGLMKSFRIRPYQEDTGYGLLRHVLIRSGRFSGEIMVVLVLASPILPSKNNFVKALLKLHPEISTIVLNVNNKSTSMVLGEKDIVLYGKGYIEDTLCGKTFRISPQSFYQVNPVQTQRLYGKAMEFAALTGKEKVLDAYCGTGTIGIIASDKAGEVIGVELNRAAVKDAKINAHRNDVKNITFYEQDAGVFMTQLAEQQAKIDVVFMDPPRSGSDEKFLTSVITLSPKKIVYISCNPHTLARDLEFLTKKGYKMQKGVGVDMFPWTNHVECVCCLAKQ